MSTTYPDAEMISLIGALQKMRTSTELAAFLRDLMTVKELKDISQRWRIVQLLDQAVPYLEIAKQVGVSTTTVTRCALWLHNGQGGYKTALSRLHSVSKNV